MLDSRMEAEFGSDRVTSACFFYFPSLYRSGRKFIVLTFCESFLDLGKSMLLILGKFFCFVMVILSKMTLAHD